MRDLWIGVLSFAAGLAVGALVVYLVMASRRGRELMGVREEQRRQWRRARLLSGLEALDLAMTGLTTAALQGSAQLAQERAAGLAQLTNAVNRSGDDELRQRVGAVVASCDALSEASRDRQALDRLVEQLGEAQREVYRRMEVLLERTFD